MCFSSAKSQDIDDSMFGFFVCRQGDEVCSTGAVISSERIKDSFTISSGQLLERSAKYGHDQHSIAVLQLKSSFDILWSPTITGLGLNAYAAICDLARVILPDICSSNSRGHQCQASCGQRDQCLNVFLYVFTVRRHGASSMIYIQAILRLSEFSSELLMEVDGIQADWRKQEASCAGGLALTRLTTHQVL